MNGVASLIVAKLHVKLRRGAHGQSLVPSPDLSRCPTALSTGSCLLCRRRVALLYCRTDRFNFGVPGLGEIGEFFGL